MLYCDTNQPETVKLSDKESKKRKVIAISICSIILLLYLVFFYEHYIWGAIITVIALLVTIGVCDTTFSGTDYFVGNKGFATRIVCRFKRQHYIFQCLSFQGHGVSLYWRNHRKNELYL